MNTIVHRCARQIDLLALHRLDPARYPFFLESSSTAHAHSRFDVLFACPGDALTLAAGVLSGPQSAGGNDFLAAFDAWYKQLRNTADPVTGLPFTGGWFFYLGYELASQIEPSLRLPEAPPGLPTALAVRCPAAVVTDRTRACSYLVAEHRNLLSLMQADLDQLPEEPTARRVITATSMEAPAGDYLRQVERIRAYIRAGDVFQVNLSREWQLQLQRETSPAALYAALRAANPAPFSGLLCWHNQAVICSSPERLLQVSNGRVQTRPIAGTRPRNNNDAAMASELLANPKERAEHIMLIDLERNDLGRVCRLGSIEVNQLMTLESYSRVHHIVSNVRGRLRPATSPVAALRAVFPGGTITGCPKIRCMQIIGELEQQGRGAYTGAFGYLGKDGQLDSNILIRTLQQEGNMLRLRAGAGIVADSIPQQELEETRAKARGVLDCLRVCA